MSFALLVVGSVACLLVLLLLLALSWLSRVERAHEAAVGVRTEERPDRAGSSGDLHLFLAFPDEHVASVRGLAERVSPSHAVPPEGFAEVVSALLASLPHATHGHAEYGHFRKIRVQAAPGATLVYLNARVRRPITTMLELGDRAAWRATLEALATITPAELVEASLELPVPTTDPAAGRPTSLSPA